MSRLYLHSISTRFGTIRTATLSDRLVLVRLPGENESDFERYATKLYPSCELGSGGEINDETERQLKYYFDGRLKQFDLPIVISGSSFQKKVLKRIGKIQYGKTMTYGAVAEAIKHPGAARAVGTTMARNPLPLVLPCHRVLAANGLGGFGGGIELKINLLRLEGVI